MRKLEKSKTKLKDVIDNLIQVSKQISFISSELADGLNAHQKKSTIKSVDNSISELELEFLKLKHLCAIFYSEKAKPKICV
jgi:alpha-D-ribose 1-methylphosphonate 5-triphosphate synthase subunit PhnG